MKPIRPRENCNFYFIFILSFIKYIFALKALGSQGSQKVVKRHKVILAKVSAFMTKYFCQWACLPCYPTIQVRNLIIILRRHFEFNQDIKNLS